MTAPISFTPSTIPYDPPTKYVLAVIPKPGSVLDAVTIYFPNVAALIRKANQQKLYTTDNPVTLIISQSFVFDSLISTSTAVNMCRSMTINRNLNIEALHYSPIFKLRTLNDPSNVIVSTDTHGIIRINGNPILYSIECTNGTIHVLT